MMPLTALKIALGIDAFPCAGGSRAIDAARGVPRGALRVAARHFGVALRLGRWAMLE